MIRLCRFLAAAAALAGLLASEPVAAQDSAATRNPVSEELELTLTPYMWFLSLDGSTTVRGLKGDVDVGFDDIWDNLNFGAMIEGEIRKGRIGAYANLIYADLEADNSTPIGKLKSEATTVWAGAGAFYRLGPWDLGGSQNNGAGTQLIIDPYAGIRYTYLDVELNLKGGGPSASKDQDWVDPLFGFRSIWRFTPRWSFTTLSDIGGFGVGSDFTWQAAAFVGYNFGIFGDDDSRLLFGYRALSQDYDTGSGTNRFEWDVTAYGPMAGLSITF